MVKDAEAHAEEDRKLMETVQARNGLDALVHSVKKSLGEYGDKIGADEKAKIEAAVNERRGAAEAEGRGQGSARGEDRGARARPRRSSARRCTRRRRRAQGGAGARGRGRRRRRRGAAAKGGGDEKVVDAEFTEVKDQK